MADPRLSVIPAAAVTDPSLEGRDLQVLCLLGRHIDDNGWCRRSQVKMAREIGCARSTVQASLGRLIAAGWVQQREEQRASGGDTAHSYRVMLDREAEPKQARAAPETGATPPADRSAPLPTGRQGVPIYASAPMLTTPLNEDEREARAREPDQPEPASATTTTATPAPRRTVQDELTARQVPNAPLLADLIARHPQGAHDRLDDVIRPWLALNPDERRTARDRFDAWFGARGKRAAIAGLPTYLGDRMFLRVAAPPPRGESPFLPAYGKAWWRLFHDTVAWAAAQPGAPLRDQGSAEASLIRRQIGLAAQRVGWKVGTPEQRAAIEEAAARLVPVRVNGPEFAAWVDHYGRIGVRMPQPDAAEWAYMPAEWPDGPEEARDGGAEQHEEMAG